MSQAEFAKKKGWSRAYVSQLKKDDRLVFDGKKIDVDASETLIAETSTNTVDASQIDSYQVSRSKREYYHALQAKMDYERTRGLLVAISDVEAAGAELGALFRVALENLQDALSPVLAAESDSEGVYAVLDERFEILLSDLEKKIKKIGSSFE